MHLSGVLVCASFCTKLVLLSGFVRRCGSKKAEKSREVLDLAEKLSDRLKSQKHPSDLTFVAAICL